MAFLNELRNQYRAALIKAFSDTSFQAEWAQAIAHLEEKDQLTFNTKDPEAFAEDFHSWQEYFSKNSEYAYINGLMTKTIGVAIAYIECDETLIEREEDIPDIVKTYIPNFSNGIKFRAKEGEWYFIDNTKPASGATGEVHLGYLLDTAQTIAFLLKQQSNTNELPGRPIVIKTPIKPIFTLIIEEYEYRITKYKLDIEAQKSEALILNNVGFRSILLDNGATLIMDRAPGVDAATFFWKKGTALSFDQYNTITCNLIDELIRIHRTGTLHLDIKPANIIIDPDSLSVKFVDYGTSKTILYIQQESLHYLTSPSHNADTTYSQNDVTLMPSNRTQPIDLNHLLSANLSLGSETSITTNKERQQFRDGGTPRYLPPDFFKANGSVNEDKLFKNPKNCTQDIYALGMTLAYAHMPAMPTQNALDSQNSTRKALQQKLTALQQQSSSNSLLEQQRIQLILAMIDPNNRMNTLQLETATAKFKTAMQGQYTAPAASDRLVVRKLPPPVPPRQRNIPNNNTVVFTPSPTNDAAAPTPALMQKQVRFKEEDTVIPTAPSPAEFVMEILENIPAPHQSSSHNTQSIIDGLIANPITSLNDFTAITSALQTLSQSYIEEKAIDMTLKSSRENIKVFHSEPEYETALALEKIAHYAQGALWIIQHSPIKDHEKIALANKILGSATFYADQILAKEQDPKSDTRNEDFIKCFAEYAHVIRNLVSAPTEQKKYKPAEDRLCQTAMQQYPRAHLPCKVHANKTLIKIHRYTQTVQEEQHWKLPIKKTAQKTLIQTTPPFIPGSPDRHTFKDHFAALESTKKPLRTQPAPIVHKNETLGVLHLLKRLLALEQKINQLDISNGQERKKIIDQLQAIKEAAQKAITNETDAPSALHLAQSKIQDIEIMLNQYPSLNTLPTEPRIMEPNLQSLLTLSEHLFAKLCSSNNQNLSIEQINYIQAQQRMDNYLHAQNHPITPNPTPSLYESFFLQCDRNFLNINLSGLMRITVQHTSGLPALTLTGANTHSHNMAQWFYQLVNHYHTGRIPLTPAKQINILDHVLFQTFQYHIEILHRHANHFDGTNVQLGAPSQSNHFLDNIRQNLALLLQGWHQLSQLTQHLKHFETLFKPNTLMTQPLEQLLTCLNDEYKNILPAQNSSVLPLAARDNPSAPIQESNTPT